MSLSLEELSLALHTIMSNITKSNKQLNRMEVCQDILNHITKDERWLLYYLIFHKDFVFAIIHIKIQ